MTKGDIIDILVAVGILILIAHYVLLFLKKEDKLETRRENSVGEKYMQLLSAFMREFKGNLTDMSENSADMEVLGEDGSIEKLSVFQNETGVSFKWTLSTELTKLTKEFKFDNNATQEEIMKAIAKGITEAKKGM